METLGPVQDWRMLRGEWASCQQKWGIRIGDHRNANEEGQGRIMQKSVIDRVRKKKYVTMTV